MLVKKKRTSTQTNCQGILDCSNRRKTNSHAPLRKFIILNAMAKDEDEIEEVEVHEIHREEVPVEDNSSNIKKALAVLLMLAALAYDASPIDLIPDVPIIGWIDDAGLTLAAGINLIQQFVGNQNASLVKLLKYAKWTFVSMVAIAVLLLGGLIALIVNLIAG